MCTLIETDRFVLRELGPDDAEEMYALNADPEVVRYTGNGPFASVEEARAFLESYDAYRVQRMGRWGVIAKDGGSWLGWCGLKRDSHGEVDLGYRLHRRFWGRGVATETGAASLEYGFGPLALDRIVGRVLPENHASHRVLQKLGMRRVADQVEDGVVWQVYALGADDRMGA
ncbi:MAG: GNAT family N-acetyltransferase [Myxococcota bacterium]